MASAASVLIFISLLHSVTPQGIILLALPPTAAFMEAALIYFTRMRSVDGEMDLIHSRNDERRREAGAAAAAEDAAVNHFKIH